MVEKGSEGDLAPVKKEGGQQDSGTDEDLKALGIQEPTVLGTALRAVLDKSFDLFGLK